VVVFKTNFNTKNKIMTTAPSMRKLWFEHVAKTRRKLQRTNKEATHRDAMKEASVSWPKEKVKVQNKIKREQRRAEKEAKTTAVEASRNS